MSIQSFTLKNYRSFVERTTIELRPLTLLFGYNNSGKSALLRALPLLADSLNGQSSTPINMESSALRGCHFNELTSRVSKSQEFEIELSLEDAKPYSSMRWTLRDIQLSREELREPRRGQPVKKKFTVETHIVSQFAMAGSDTTKKIEVEWVNAEWVENFWQHKYHIKLPNQPDREHPLEFKGLLPSLKMLNGKKSSAKWLSILEQLQNLATRVQWLTSVRQSPLRFNLSQGNLLKLSPDGQGAAAILDYGEKVGKPILAEVSRWYEIHVNQRLDIVRRDSSFKIILEPLLDAPWQINIADMGEGLIQVLPVLVACGLARESQGILAIEEPESHLHPRLHAALAGHFCELVRQPQPPKVLLETHSENFLLRVQLEIAQGKLDPNLVMVYWIRPLEEGGSIAEPVTFDYGGQPLGNHWPRGGFSQQIEQKREILEAQRGRSKLVVPNDESYHRS